MRAACSAAIADPTQLLTFLIGYFTQNIQYAVWTMAGGAGVVFLAVVPPWPWYNKHPESWLPSQDELAGLSISMSAAGT